MSADRFRALRPGRNADAAAPNAANYDEALANPYPSLPDALALKRGAKVTTVDAWWNQRRGEIVEDFEREICMTLVTPADTQVVPVMIMFGGGALPAEAAARPRRRSAA